MKFVFALPLLAVASLACTKTPEPPEPPPPMMTQFCMSAEPPEAVITVQGMRLNKDGCAETFPGELAIEITAPGYKTYQTLFFLEGHARKQHIVLERAAPTSVSQPSSASQPAASQPSK